MTLVKEVSRCRSCQGELHEVISLGVHYVSDFLLPSEEGIKAPLTLVKCQSCQLVQLSHTVNPEKMFSHFWYQSSISSTMKEALKNIVDNALKTTKLNAGDKVVDIGSNDGTLLDYYPETLYKVGFEPAANVIGDSYERSHIINDYFTLKAWRKHFYDAKAKIITSIAMFYDLDEPNAFVDDITEVLADEGTWIVQMNYLPAMLENNCYDNITHDHLEYYSLSSLSHLLKRNGLEAYSVERNDVNGGSFRVYISFGGKRPVEASVYRMLKEEELMKLDTDLPYKSFKDRIDSLKSELRRLILDKVSHGKVVYAYGAGTRGNTILQYSGLDHTVIKKACDANPEKYGRVTVGTHIPIISKEQTRIENPDYFLVLPYHFLDEIEQQESDYLKNGGGLIVPIPRVRLMSKGGL